MEAQEKELAQDARAEVEEMDWAAPSTVTKGVTILHDADTHEDHLSRLTGEHFGSGSEPSLA